MCLLVIASIPALYIFTSFNYNVDANHRKKSLMLFSPPPSPPPSSSRLRLLFSFLFIFLLRTTARERMSMGGRVGGIEIVLKRAKIGLQDRLVSGSWLLLWLYLDSFTTQNSLLSNKPQFFPNPYLLTSETVFFFTRISKLSAKNMSSCPFWCILLSL